MLLTISASELVKRWSEVLSRVERGDIYVITRFGKSVAAMIPMSDFERLYPGRYKEFISAKRRTALK